MAKYLFYRPKEKTETKSKSTGKSSRPNKADSSGPTHWLTSSQEPTLIRNQIHLDSRRPTPSKEKTQTRENIIKHVWGLGNTMIIQARVNAGSGAEGNDDQYPTYQIGVVADDTNSVFLSVPDIESAKLHIIAPMTRKRGFGSFHPFNLEIEKTLNMIKKSKNMHVGHASDNFSFVTETDNFEMKPNFLDNPLYEPNPIENNNNRTLKELTTLDVLYRPWCIQYPQLEPAQTYKLKSRLIHLLLKFHSLAGEDPHKHLKEFHVVYSTMRP
ncbi:hypothetical protein CR513_22097, partial [Mucuna pruriens]